MTRTAPSLATMSRAYVSGRVAALRPPSPHQAHRMSEALAQAAPEVAAAYELGRAADPRLPLPGAQDVLAQVVQRLARPSVEELSSAGTWQATPRHIAGPWYAAPGQLGQNEGRR